MKKLKYIIVGILIVIILLFVFNYANLGRKGLDSERPLTTSQLVTKNNRELIGKGISINADQVNAHTVVENKSKIIREYDSSMTYDNITEIVLKSNSENKYTTPEIILINGAPCIFTKDDGSGWTLSKGDVISFEYEKYPSEIIDKQVLVIGYILNGKLYSGEAFGDLDGEYKLEIEGDGEYYIYVTSASSDYLTLREGSLKF